MIIWKMMGVVLREQYRKYYYFILIRKEAFAANVYRMKR
jgi:hypothetical protein